MNTSSSSKLKNLFTPANTVSAISFSLILLGIFGYPLYLKNSGVKKVNTDEGLPNGLIRRGAFGNSGSKDIGVDDTHARIKQQALPEDLRKEYEALLQKRQQSGFSPK